MLISKELSEPP